MSLIEYALLTMLAAATVWIGAPKLNEAMGGRLERAAHALEHAVHFGEASDKALAVEHAQ